MLCRLCHRREATVHLTQITGDKMQKMDLCESCAQAKGIDDPTVISLAALGSARGEAPRPRPEK